MSFTDMTKVESTPFSLRGDLHLTRKLWHVGTGVLGLWLYYKSGFSSFTFGLILLGVSLLGFLIDFIRLRNTEFNRFAQFVMRRFMRESEKNGLSGLPFYALGVSLSLFFYSEKIAILSILFLVFSDPLSSFFGVLFGKDKILPNKSLQGTTAGFITCYCISLIYGLTYSTGSFNILSFALLAGVIGACSELLSAFNVDDNLTIPVASGLGITLINLYLNIL